MSRHGVDVQPDGVALIAAERNRQIDALGYTVEHDIEHIGTNELEFAAAAYALNRLGLWPWRARDFAAGHDHLRDLVKAGALIAAAIDARLAGGVKGGDL